MRPGNKLLPDQILIWIHVPIWRHALGQKHIELTVPMSLSSLLHVSPGPSKLMVVIILMMYYHS